MTEYYQIKKRVKISMGYSKGATLLDYALRYIQQLEISSSMGWLPWKDAEKEILRIHNKAMRSNI